MPFEHLPKPKLNYIHSCFLKKYLGIGSHQPSFFCWITAHPMVLGWCNPVVQDFGSGTVEGGFMGYLNPSGYGWIRTQLSCQSSLLLDDLWPTSLQYLFCWSHHGSNKNIPNITRFLVLIPWRIPWPWVFLGRTRLDVSWWPLILWMEAAISTAMWVQAARCEI